MCDTIKVMFDDLIEVLFSTEKFLVNATWEFNAKLNSSGNIKYFRDHIKVHIKPMINLVIKKQ